jgi:hypothetical protein
MINQWKFQTISTILRRVVEGVVADVVVVAAVVVVTAIE